MKMKMYLSESNSWIYFHIVLNKNWKIYWSKQSFTSLCPQDRCSSWGLILILFVDHLCSNLIFIIWYFCNNIAWRYQKDNQNPYIEEKQTTKWPNDKVQKDKQRSTKTGAHHEDWYWYYLLTISVQT
jgi:hypothetical protein